MTLGDSRIKRVRDRLDLLNMLTVRVAVLEYSQLHKKAYNFSVCEFGGFENVLRDAVIRAIRPGADLGSSEGGGISARTGTLTVDRPLQSAWADLPTWKVSVQDLARAFPAHFA